jgi:ABC-type phosphate transport system substrate-binding protein
LVTESIMTLASRIGFTATLVLCLSGAVADADADVVAVVSAKSPITALSKSQVADLFIGKVSRFPNGLQAFPVDQAEGSSLRDEFYGKVVGITAAQLKAYWSKIIFTGRGQPPPTVSNTIEMKKRIRDNPAAIGYIEKDMVDDSVRVVF